MTDEYFKKKVLALDYGELIISRMKQSGERKRFRELLNKAWISLENSEVSSEIHEYYKRYFGE